MAYEIFSNIVTKQDVRYVQSKALRMIALALQNSFGPNGQNTAYRNNKDIARYTKDGHTILKNLKFTGAIEFTMRDNLEAITRRIITTVGDGTTSAIILSSCLFDALCWASDTFHINEKKLIDDLNKAIEEATNIIQGNAKDATVDDIYKIAMISTDNNEFIANIIKDIYEKHGKEVMIDVSTATGVDTEIKTYDGFTLDSGLCDIAFINTDKHTCELNDVKLYLFEDPIDTPEMCNYFSKIIMDNVIEPMKRKAYNEVQAVTVVCPRVGKDIETEIDTIVRQMAAMKPAERKFYPVNIVTNISNVNFINDLAYISGAKLIKKYNETENQENDAKIALAQKLETIHEFAGHCEMVVSDSRKTKFINPDMMYDKDGELTDIYKNHLHDMEEQLNGLREERGNHGEIGAMKRRINAFKANLVEIRVGGISETDRDSLRDLVEDAVLNCRSAATDGYGYGANFEALRAFNHLLSENTKDMTEEEIQNISEGKAYNIYQIITDAYINMLKILYYSVSDGDENKAGVIALSGIVEGCPYNIRTGKYDGLVLSSIKSDQIILDAIGKIIGTVFLTNQFLVEGPEYNRYKDAAKVTPINE